jgi:hypothetical protein
MRIIQNLGFAGLLLAGAGTQLAAQETHKGWVAGAALPIAADELKQWTNQSFMGICLEGAYQIPIAESRNCFRVGLGFNYLPGKEQYIPDSDQHKWKISLTNIQVNLDVLFPIGSSQLSLLTGLSLNTWNKSVTGKDPWDPDGDELDISGTVKYAFGKYGLRLGAEYALNNSLSVALTLQLTELGTDWEFYADKWFEYDGKPNRDIYGGGYRAVNPTWVQLGARYRF